MKLRNNNIKKLEDRAFDVFIIGGGINGAVSAASLSARGVHVALIEKGDFAGYTSQESSNLIWGGIKYLESGELRLVRKLCHSRNHLLRTYPSSIKEIRFYTSLAKKFRWPKVFLYVGTILYWIMGNFFTKPPRILSKKNILKEEPSIEVKESQGGVEYSDAYLVDNDARFVYNFIRDALDHGAICSNYTELVSATPESDGTWHIQAIDQIGGQHLNIRSRVLINATGPFVDQNNRLLQIESPNQHLLSKGVHLIVNRISEVDRVLTFFADDGRLFFVIPMGPKSCIGTTDTPVQTLPPRINQEDRQFILDNINARLKLQKPLTPDDIIAERCGVRPLAVSSKKSLKEGDWTALSRKHIIEVQEGKKHISIYGGKLTDCLNIGEEITDAVAGFGILPIYPKAKWYGEPPKNTHLSFLHQARLMDLDSMTSKDSSEPLSTRLWRRYRTSAFELLEQIREDPRMADVLIEGAEYIRCELHLASRREMIIKLEDFLRRRSKIALITRPETLKNAPGLKDACKILFGDEADQKFQEYFSQ